MATAWVAVIGTLGGVALGHWLTWSRVDRERARRVRGNLEALKAEILYCGAVAEAHLKSGRSVPGYRLPTIVFDGSFPELLKEGIFAGRDSAAVIQFYVDAKSFNRSLDLAQTATSSAQMASQEVNRAQGKAKHISPGTEHEPSRYDAALDSVLRQIPGSSVERPIFRKGEPE